MQGDILKRASRLLAALLLVVVLTAACRLVPRGSLTLIVANFTREPVSVLVSERTDGGWSTSREVGSVQPGSRKGVLSIPASTAGGAAYRVETRRTGGAVACRWEMTLAQIAERGYTLYVDDLCGDLSRLTPSPTG